MTQHNNLGAFEQLVLFAILRLRGNAYGMALRREIEERAGRKTSIGALYLTLNRMQQKGLIQSQLGEATPEPGGRAKRFYTVNSSGREALKRSVAAVRKMADGFNL